MPTRQAASYEISLGEVAQIAPFTSNKWPPRQHGHYVFGDVEHLLCNCDLLQQLGDGEQLFRLAFDERLPAAIKSAVGQQAIRHARLKAAIAHAASQSDLDRLVKRVLLKSRPVTLIMPRTQRIFSGP